MFTTAYAHTTVEVGPYAIEVGWGIEPPVVGLRNDFVFEISESPSEGVKAGVKGGFKNLEATAKFGGITKKLDINVDPKPGHYYSPVIPTRTGTISMEVKGDINGVPVDVDIPIEDVESRSLIDFPPGADTTSGQDITALKNALSSLQKDVSDIKSGVVGVTADDSLGVGPAYDFAIFGLSLGAAGVILAIIAMIKRK